MPVLDRGFLFGDGIYEVVQTASGVPFAWREHVDRLWVSAAGMAMELDIDEPELRRRVVATMARARRESDCADEFYIRIIATRGVGTAPNIAFAHASGPPLWLIMVRPAVVTRGPARIAIIERQRNDRRALDPAIKSGNYLNNVLGLAEAHAVGADEAVFLNADGYVTEVSVANLFVVDATGVLRTPPLEAGILAGITRQHVLGLAEEDGIPTRIENLRRQDLESAAEILLTSTTRGAQSVVACDGRPVGSVSVGEAAVGEAAAGEGAAGAEGGPVGERLRTLYSAFVAARVDEDRALFA